ncbi:MAG: acyloxyacyl hydrolase [Thiohalomonadaceae bacterium]
MKARYGKPWLLAPLLLAWAHPIAAFDGLAVSVGDGLGNVEMLRVSLLARQRDHAPDHAGWNLRIHWEFGLACWRAHDSSTGVDEIYNANVTPVLRFSPTGRRGARPYAEFGLGFHVLSDDRIEDRTLSSTYHFGSHVGVGLVTGGDRRFDLGVRYQHLSNASLETPNPGIDFAIARIGWLF